MYRFSDSSKNTVWDNLVAATNHWFEPRVRINGTYYGQSTIVEMKTEYRVFSDENPGVGGCLAGELTLSMLAPSAAIPRMAKVEPFVRVTNGTTTSDWMPQGKFYIDTRETTQNDDGLPILMLHCFDAMLKTEADYPSASDATYADITIVRRVAYTIGLQSSLHENAGIDSRTVTLLGDTDHGLGLPIGYSMREILSKIAVLYGGNWCMNYDGQLYLVPIDGIPAETNYLVTSLGNPITFGGVRILV